MVKTILVAVVAFGKTSLSNIATILVQLGIPYRIVLAHEIPTFNYSHIILTGGPKYVTRYEDFTLPQWIISSNAPVLGICYGMTLIAKAVGGTVQRLPEKEYGVTEIVEIINGYQQTKLGWMNRHYEVISLPRSFRITGVTSNDDIASFTDHDKWWGLQYHPESVRYRDVETFRSFLLL